MHDDSHQRSGKRQSGLAPAVEASKEVKIHPFSLQFDHPECERLVRADHFANLHFWFCVCSTIFAIFLRLWVQNSQLAPRALSIGVPFTLAMIRVAVHIMMFDQAKGSDIFAHFTTGSALALMAARLSKAVSGNESPMLTENALHAVCAICGLLCLLSHICHFPSTNKVLIIVMAVAAFIRPGYVHCIGHWSTIGVAQCRLQLTAALVIGSLVGYLCEWIVRTMWLERLRCARKRREQNVLDPVAEEPLCMHAATLLFSGASAEVAIRGCQRGN